jgi:phosphatidate cytidylyltransferase
MSNIVIRAITGLFFALFIISATFLGGWYFQVLFGLVTILTLNEFYGLFKKSEVSPNISQGLIFGTIFYVIGLYCIQNKELNTSFIAMLVFLFPLVGLAELFRNKKTPFQNIGVTIIGLLYIVVPFLLINLMRVNTNNYWPVLSIFILTWSSDTFAYLIGSKIGKHRLFERISPKKSWEGFAAGLIFSIMAGLIIAYFTNDDFIKYAIYGGVIATFGTLGDLVESMLKRSLKIKDSGTILPGHGGLLDRFDAVIFIIPIIYFLENFIFNT